MQSQPLADVNVSPPNARVRSRDFSMLCKHLECYVSSKATTMEMLILPVAIFSGSIHCFISIMDIPL